MKTPACVAKIFGSLEPYQTCPSYWVGSPEMGLPFMETLRHARIVSIGRSSAGHEIPAIEYGEHETLTSVTDNLAGALASTVGKADPTDIYPPAFYGTTRRKAPVVVIQGALHGGEITGTVAALNLCKIIETGTDLRGKAWPRLQELACRTRLLIIPWLNMDGAHRCILPNPSGASADLYNACTFGVDIAGNPNRYLTTKNYWPVPPEKTAYMGTYFNDAGYNLQYDFCQPERQPETKAWMKYYLAERPDGVLVLHGNAGTLIGPAEAYLPEGFQHEISRLSGAVRQRLVRDGLPAGRLSWVGLPGMGKPFINQINAIYHVCGALPILHELPSGAEPAVMTPDAMLDCSLITFEEFLLYTHHDGLRPYEWREKVMRKGTT